MPPLPKVGRRLAWQQVPSHVRQAVEAILGASVVEARTQAGGFSPGAAARVRLANGGTAFVKALSVDVHPSSVGLYRVEAATMPHLPKGLPVPRLLDVYDDGNWVALVYEEVDGRHPDLPWRPDELQRVAAALADLGAALQPSPWPAAPDFVETNRGFLEAWMALAPSPPPHLEPRRDGTWTGSPRRCPTWPRWCVGMRCSTTTSAPTTCSSLRRGRRRDRLGRDVRRRRRLAGPHVLRPDGHR